MNDCSPEPELGVESLGGEEGFPVAFALILLMREDMIDREEVYRVLKKRMGMR